MALLLNPAHFGHFVPASTQFLQLFLGSKKSSWDDEIMMSCTRLYVDLTYAIMYHRKGNMLLSLLGRWLENTRGHNLLFIIITSNYSKQAFKEAKNWIWRALLSTLCYLRSFPNHSLDLSRPPYPPSTSNLSLLPPPFKPPHTPRWDLARDCDDECRRFRCPPLIQIRTQVGQWHNYWSIGGICIL